MKAKEFAAIAANEGLDYGARYYTHDTIDDDPYLDSVLRTYRLAAEELDTALKGYDEYKDW